MKTPTKTNITLLEIARIGIFLDDYAEKYRGTNPKTYGRLAAENMVAGEPIIFDNEEIFREYWPQVESCFTKSGKLGWFVRKNLYGKV